MLGDLSRSTLLDQWVASTRDTFDPLPNIVFILNLDIEYVYLNNHTVSLFPDIEVGETPTNIYFLFPTKTSDRIVTAAKELIKTGDVQSLRLTFSALEASVMCALQLSPIRSGDDIIGILGVSRNMENEVTTKKRLETRSQYLNNAILQLQRLLDGTPIGIMISQHNTILYVNDKLCEMVKRKPEETIRLDINSFLKLKDKKYGDPSTILEQFDMQEIQIYDSEGVRIPVMLSSKKMKSPIYQGKVVFSYFEDLRLQKEKEKLEKLISDRKHQQNRIYSLGNLAAGIAHEINNYMTPISAGASMIFDNAPEDLKREAMSILEATDDVKRITYSILEFAGYRTIDAEAKLQRLDEIISDGSYIFNTITSHITYNLEPTYTCFVDKREINQIVLNLLQNAKEASESDGITDKTILLETGKVEIGEQFLEENHIYGELGTGKYSYLTISNYGDLDENIISRIFEPYFTSKGFGKGLGLPIILGVLRLNSGMISVSVDEKVHFTVYLPLIETKVSHI